MCDHEEEEEEDEVRQSCGSGQKEGERYLEKGGADAPALLVMLAVAGLPVCDRRGEANIPTLLHNLLPAPPTMSSLYPARLFLHHRV